MNEKGVYQYIDNLVQIMENTPSGSVWLIFCLYTLSADQRTEQGIYPTITHMEQMVIIQYCCTRRYDLSLHHKDNQIRIVAGYLYFGLKFSTISRIIERSVAHVLVAR